MEKGTEGKLRSIKDVADDLNISTQKVHRDISRGNLEAFKVGWNWIINEISFINYKNSLANESDNKEG